jgi:hypothetical protein
VRDDPFLFFLIVLSIGVCGEYFMMKFFPDKYREMEEARERRFRFLGSVAKKCVTPTTVRAFVKFLKW